MRKMVFNENLDFIAVYTCEFPDREKTLSYASENFAQRKRAAIITECKTYTSLVGHVIKWFMIDRFFLYCQTIKFFEENDELLKNSFYKVINYYGSFVEKFCSLSLLIKQVHL